MHFNSRHAYIVHVCMLVTDRAMAFVLMAYCACGIDRYDETVWLSGCSALISSEHEISLPILYCWGLLWTSENFCSIIMNDFHAFHIEKKIYFFAKIF